MSNIIVLASGGVDSTLVMHKLLETGNAVYPLFTDYGQLSVEGELGAVVGIVELLRHFKNLGDYPFGSLAKLQVNKVDIGQHVMASPGRVLAFVGAAAIWAFTNDWQKGKIAIGIHKGDKDQDSCRVGYEDSLNECLKSLTQDKLEIITPLMGMTREDMAREFEAAKLPWDMVWNCYWATPCGYQSPSMEYRCPGCRRKQEAMKLVGRPESEWKVPNKYSSSSRRVGRRDWKYV